MYKDERKLALERLEIYLKTRCGGLLEISQSFDTLSSKVHYLHKAVKEFL